MKENKLNNQELLNATSINNNCITIINHNSIDNFPKVEHILKQNNLSIKAIYGLRVDMLVNQVIIPVTILVRNQIGLKNLYKIISSIKTKNLVHYGKQVITKKEMVKFSNGLLYGLDILDMIDIYENISNEDISKDIMWYDFIILDPSKIKSSKEYVKHIVNLCKQNRKLIVTNNKDIKNFSFLKNDLANEIVFKNTKKLESLINKVEIIKNKIYFPIIKNSKEIFIKQIYENAHRLYGKTLPDIVEKRIQEELYGKDKNNNFGIINTKSESIYLIYKELIEKSKQYGYSTIPRGDISSSFLAYLIGITEINPLPSHYHCLKCGYSEFNDENNIPFSNKYDIGIDMPNKECPNCHTLMNQDGFNLYYEMLLGCNVEKNPNIIINFDINIQKKLEHFLEKKFGKKNIIHAGVIGFPNRKDSSTKKITGILPGGIFIVPKALDIYDFTPIAYPCDDIKYNYITHFDYHDIKHLMKFNILGHTLPEEIKKLEKYTKIKSSTIPLNDKETFNFLCSGKTDSIFEFSIPLAKKLLKELKYPTFNDLINIIGLVHNNENNNSILSNIIFKEDIYHYFIQNNMEENLAYSITKFISNGKIKNDNHTWMQYKQIMKEYNIDKNFIKECNNISYLISKSHCVSYAIVAFQIAWYKVHFPEIFNKVINELK